MIKKERNSDNHGGIASVADRIVADALSMGEQAAPSNQHIFNAVAALDDCRVDLAAEIAAPNFCFRYDGVEFHPFGTLSVISGKAKNGKTQWVNILCAVLLGGRSFGDLCRIHDPLAPVDGGNVVWFDTEQSKYNVQRNVRRLQNICGFRGNDTAAWGLNIYALNTYSPEERLRIINAAIEKHSPQAVIIDGIRDLLHNPNDEMESYNVVEWLQSLVADEQMSVFVIIHENAADGKMRGHLGTELLNKVSDRWRVVKKDKYFEVQHQSRNEQMPVFTFHFDERGNLQPWAAEPPRGRG